MSTKVQCKTQINRLVCSAMMFIDNDPLGRADLSKNSIKRIAQINC